MKYTRRELDLSTLVSPPSRGAWIEIYADDPMVAVVPGRPPRGGRGLKLQGLRVILGDREVAPLAGGVD